MDIKDIAKIMQDAKNLKEKFQQSKAELTAVKVTGVSGADDVTITINGAHQVLSTKISPELIEYPVNVIEELITGAINDAINKVNEHTKVTMNNLSDVFNL